MAKITGGYILKARKSLESDLMDKPPLWSKLWDWMLLRAEWRVGAKMGRGSFHTSISEMREAMSYKIGYRKKLPTVGEIRSAYEAFTNNTMISTTKSTRGMVITILNYSKYQDPKNYEAHNEQHNEEPTNNTVTTQDSKEEEESNKRERVNANAQTDARPRLCEEKAWEEYLSFSRLFLEKQSARWGAMCKPTESKAVNGAKAIDNLIRVQGFVAKTVYETIEWARNDDFWSVNLLSLAALTKKGRNGEIKFRNILAQRAKGEMSRG